MTRTLSAPSLGSQLVVGMMEGLDQILIQRTMKELGLSEAEATRRVQAEVDRRVEKIMTAIEMPN